MKIVVNARFLLKDKLEGIGWFTYETLKRITTQHPEHEFVFLFDRPFDKSFVFSDNVRPVKLFPPARHPFLWYWWFEKSVAKILKKEKPDLFLSQDGFMCLNTTVPTTLVVHDLAFEHYPDGVGKKIKNFYQKYTPQYCKKAHRIATVSAFTKQDIVKQYGISSEKIDVVYNGANESFHPLEDKQTARDRFTEGKEYFIYVGAIHPRKNVERLLKAFDDFKKKSNSDAKLLLVGRKAWKLDEMEKVFQNLQFKKDVIFEERLNVNELNKAIGGAIAMVYVSLFEGFGIPVLEAQYCGVPVITSNVSSMPEVAGDAALLVDPTSVESIAEAMIKLCQDEDLQEKLVVNGEKNKRNFTWQLTADKLWDCMMKSVNEEV